jgi:hypothetical protein
MNRRSRLNRLLAALLGLTTLVVSGSLIPYQLNGMAGSGSDAGERHIAAGWTVGVLREMPQPVTALIAVQDLDYGGEDVYIGTGGVGAVHRFHRGGELFLSTTKTIAVGLGDDQRFSDCQVSRLAICDLDHDGTPELVAETSQVMPRGRPRLYVWSLAGAPVLRGFARPDIESSWGHGLGILHSPDGRPDHILSTYCGYGEVVAYQFSGATSPDGFQQEAVGWRTIDRLPASGEGVQVADADNDGSADVCLATGYEVENAALQIRALNGNEVAQHPKLVIDESRRFGTVKFLVGSVSRDGLQDTFVWWATGLGDGDIELIRYRLDPQGITSRVPIASGTSAEIWSVDGQMTMADMDRDGCGEVWFATASGRLWPHRCGR